MSEPAWRIREARAADLPGITEIYNEAIETTTATFDTEPKSLEERGEWFRAHTGRWPIIVAAEGAGEESRVLGWAALSRWSERCAYDGAAELSFYVGSPHRGRGVGRRLAREIIRRGREAGLHTLLAVVADESEASTHILGSEGFAEAGALREVGLKFGRLLDVKIFQLIF